MKNDIEYRINMKKKKDNKEEIMDDELMDLGLTGAGWPKMFQEYYSILKPEEHKKLKQFLKRKEGELNPLDHYGNQGVLLELTL